MIRVVELHNCCKLCSGQVTIPVLGTSGGIPMIAWLAKFRILNADHNNIRGSMLPILAAHSDIKTVLMVCHPPTLPIAFFLFQVGVLAAIQLMLLLVFMDNLFCSAVLCFYYTAVFRRLAMSTLVEM